MSRHLSFAFVLLFLLFSASGHAIANEHDTRLRQLIADHGLQSMPEREAANEAVLSLGKSLFFDRELSGNRDLSCATCHHPSSSSADARALPSGVGGHGLGAERTQDAEREVVPRNAPEIFHRGHDEWTSVFWDSRVSEDSGTFTSPAGEQLPNGLNDVLSIQAMFPVTSRAEMRGNDGDLDINGQMNEIAQVPDGDFTGIWSALTNRLMSIPAYRQAFEQAYPELAPEEIGFEHAAKAIATFEIDTFSPNDSAWDRYLGGDNSALSTAAKRGAAHFYSGNCASCHAGNLMTDQEHHNLAVPQFGPGKDASHMDIGLALETGESEDEFKFRTPPLRNLTLTGPWMHNGAFATLEETIRHHYDPETSLEEYDVSKLPEHLRSTLKLDEQTVQALTADLDSMLPIGETLTDSELSDIMAFLGSLTSPSADLMLHITPDSVLSGLEVETLPASELEILYNPEDGSLSLVGNPDLNIDSLFLRILGDEEVGFEFATGTAPWTIDPDIVLSDEPDAQSFLDYRADPEMMLSAGDTIASLLPRGLTEDEVSNYLLGAYRVHGSPTLWSAAVASVPEPCGFVLTAFLLLAPGTVRRSRRQVTKPGTVAPSS